MQQRKWCLAVAAALASAVSGVPVPPDAVIFGEVGLAGEIRPVAHTEARLKEAAKLGFSQAIVPVSRNKGKNRRASEAAAKGMELSRISRVDEIVRLFGPERAISKRHGTERAVNG